MRYQSSIAAATIAIVAIGCSGSKAADTGPQPANVIVTPGTVTIPQKGSATLTVSVTDKDQRLLTGVAVTFEASNPSILSVSNLGLITSLGPAGATSVIVHAGPASATVPVVVTQVITGITVTPDPLTVLQKSTAQLQAQVVDAAGAAVGGAVITYTPSNAAMIGVSAAGLVLSLGPAGSSTITLSSGVLTHNLAVSVTPVAADLQLSASTLAIAQGGRGQLAGIVVDLAGAPMPNPTITWTSSNPGLVTVSATGLVTSVGNLGSAVITAQSGAFIRTATVNVITASHPAGTVVATVDVPNAWGVAISPAGVVFAPKLDGSAVLRATLPATSFTIAVSGVGGLGAAFNSSGSTAYIADGSRNRIDIVDVVTNTATGSIAGFNQAYAVIVSRDDRTIYVGIPGSTVIPVDLSTNTLLAGISAPNVNAFCGHPSQPLVYASSDGTGRVVEINTSTNAATARSFPVTGGHVQQCAVSADGSAIYILVEDADLFVYDLTTGAQRPTIVGGGGFGAAMTADGTQLWVASRATVKIIDLALGTIRNVAVPANARRIAFTKDGLTAVVTSDAGKITFIQ